LANDGQIAPTAQLRACSCDSHARQYNAYPSRTVVRRHSQQKNATPRPADPRLAQGHLTGERGGTHGQVSTGTASQIWRGEAGTPVGSRRFVAWPATDQGEAPS